jgi:hypothetical protein
VISETRLFNPKVLRLRVDAVRDTKEPYLLQFSFYLDGVLLASHGPLEGEQYWSDVDVPPEKQRREWLDLNIRVNAVGVHWSDPPQLTVADIYNFAWTER